MFTWLNKQGVKSSEGFIVQAVARFVIEYWEAENCLSIDIEDGYGPSREICVIVELSNFRSWDNGVHIPIDKQKDILQNFKDAMDFQGIGVIVVVR